MAALAHKQVGLHNPHTCRILAAIAENQKVTIRELVDIAGLQSTSSVGYHIRWLFDKGYIQLKYGQARTRVLTRRAEHVLTQLRVDGTDKIRVAQRY